MAEIAVFSKLTFTVQPGNLSYRAMLVTSKTLAISMGFHGVVCESVIHVFMPCRLMKEATKLARRCTYLNILRATTNMEVKNK